MAPRFETKGSKSDPTLVLQVHDCDVALLIALRRTVLADVETVAFAFEPYDDVWNDITVITNTGCLHNEWLCHRLSLLPIHFDSKEIRNFNPDDYKFLLSASADKTQHVDVTSNDIEVYHKGKRDARLAHRLFPADPFTQDHVLLTRLRWSTDPFKEELALECKARKGSGSVHARWSPVSRCTYHMLVDATAAQEKRAAINDKDALHQFDTIDVHRCFVTDKYGNPSAFEMHVESECGMSAYEILLEAFNVLRTKLERVKDGKNIEFNVPDPLTPTFVNITVTGESPTTAALIQAIVYEVYIRPYAENERKVTFIGYTEPHPLQDIIIIKLKQHISGDHQEVFSSMVSKVIDWVLSAEKALRSSV